MPQINSSLVAHSAATGLAAMIKLQDSIATSANPDWRHAFDLVDLWASPMEDLHAMLATAPSALAAVFVAAAITMRSGMA